VNFEDLWSGSTAPVMSYISGSMTMNVLNEV
jgi:hypothetical protein